MNRLGLLQVSISSLELVPLSRLRGNASLLRASSTRFSTLGALPPEVLLNVPRYGFDGEGRKLGFAEDFRTVWGKTLSEAPHADFGQSWLQIRGVRCHRFWRFVVEFVVRMQLTRFCPTDGQLGKRDGTRNLSPKAA
jgi:hypothetical protein